MQNKITYLYFIFKPNNIFSFLYNKNIYKIVTLKSICKKYKLKLNNISIDKYIECILLLLDNNINNIYIIIKNSNNYKKYFLYNFLYKLNLKKKYKIINIINKEIISYNGCKKRKKRYL